MRYTDTPTSVASGSVSEAAGLAAGCVIESACGVDVRGADIEFVHSVIMVSRPLHW